MTTETLIAALAADNGFARRQAIRRRNMLLAAFGAALVSVGALFLTFVGIRQDLSAPGVLHAVLRKEAVAGAAGLAGLALAWSWSRPDARKSALWVLPALVLASLLIWEVATFGMQDWSRRLIGGTGLVCLAMIPTIAALPLAAMLALLKHRAPQNPSRAGAAAGLAAAGLGAAIYATHCTEDSMLFLTLWYGLACGVLVTAGTMIGGRWLRW